ncbi:DUF418 domain-containing protein [Evansella halocellulosilytica]|uniref:DUF418 domain-containing protein n=1 Tax=Evansella halocellulosilytica TaxID=2011013 RepID=UPI000BB7613C|nr:DUF418 domain-containing protein [Evansella halocellulosilytica]
MTKQNHTESKLNSLSPVDSTNRLTHIDSLRGFSLLGILLVNMLSFQYGLVGYTYITDSLHLIDQWTLTFTKWFLQGSFYPIFAILFGFGAAILWERIQEKNKSFTSIFIRRLILLIGIGFLHNYFIWDGDILLTYGTTALALFFFYKRPVKTLRNWVIVVLLLIIGVSFLSGGEEDEYFGFEPYVEYEAEVLSEGSYQDVVFHRFNTSIFDKMKMPPDIDPMQKEFMIGFTAFFNHTMTFLQTFMLFLIGLIFAKTRLLHQLHDNRTPLKKMAAIGITFGLLIKAGSVFTGSGSLEFFGYFIGGPLLSLGYIALFSLVFSRNGENSLFKGISYVGRMSLTNYLTQSIVMTTIFYGYGFGLFGQLGFFIGVILALLLFFMQVIFSRFWLSRYSFGPVEWLWRSATYWQRQPLKKSQKDE